MNQTFAMIGKVIGWIALTIAFACIGLGTDNPAMMVPLYGVIFVVISAGILLYCIKHKRRTFDDIKTPAIVPQIVGGILLILALLFPSNMLTTQLAGLLSAGSVILFTIVILALGFAGVYFINKLGVGNILFTAIGYILVIASAAIPAFLIAPIDASYSTMGVLYFTLTIETVVAWSGFYLIYNTLKKN